MTTRCSRVRVRMAPSPTGSPHVGLARTALFNWAFARHHGGTFVFRIEDTDKERSHPGVLRLADRGDALARPRLGRGPARRADRYGPYRQSERTEIYADVLARLREPRLDVRLLLHHRRGHRAAQGVRLQGQGYDGFCRELTDEQVAAFRAEGRAPVVRFRMPDGEITFDDLVRGEITFQTEFVPDFALCRANGDPLYTLVNPVDDALMEITHVLRGEDLLSEHAAPGRAVRGADRPRHREGDPASSATCPT